MTTDEESALPQYDRLAAAAIPGWCVPPRRPRNRAQLADAICQIMRHAQGASECQFCNGAACSSLEATAVADLVLALGFQLVSDTDRHDNSRDPDWVAKLAFMDALYEGDGQTLEMRGYADRMLGAIRKLGWLPTSEIVARIAVARMATLQGAARVAESHAAKTDTGGDLEWSRTETAEEIAAALRALPPSSWQATHQHRKGGLYRVITRGSLEADLTPAVVYDDAEGRVWIRPAAEFDDGRFTPVIGEAP